MSIFEKRRANFSAEGELLGFNLAAVAEALDTVAALNEQNVGGETVQRRSEGEFKDWDPEVFKVDKDIEDKFRRRLEETGAPWVLLSEEAGRVEIGSGASDRVQYVVSDPFDGSYLFKRGIPDFWYSSLAFFDCNFAPLTCAVGDGVHKKIAFADDSGAYIAELKGDHLVNRFRLDRAFRVEVMKRKEITELKDASIESYAMKPKKFLMPLVDQWRELLNPFKFFLPNGGPYGFVDVAEGKIDVYFACRQPFVDVFSGILVAERAETCVTDFDGRPVKCSDNVKSTLDVVASTNLRLHEKVLEAIAKCRKASQ